MRISGTIMAVFVTLAAAGNMTAQKKSVGAVIAPDRAGFGYQQFLDEDTFWNFDVGVDYGAHMLGQDSDPGVRISFGYNFIIWDKTYPEGRSRIYAGPGITAGYLADKDNSHGGLAGVTGNFGFEHDFGIPVTLSVSISPTLGLHLHNTERGLQLKSYINGLLWSFAPQAGIRYTFGAREKTSGGRALCMERKGKRPLFTFGIEIDYASTIACTYHHNFRSAEGYRVNEKESGFLYNGNGAVLVHAGLNLGRHYNLSLYAGYEGLADNFRVFPVSIRNTWLFGKKADHSGWLCYVDAGCGFRDAGGKPAITGKAGGGYRLSLSGKVNLDFLLSYRIAYAELPLVENGENVPESRIMRNNNYLSAINIGIGITL